MKRNLKAFFALVAVLPLIALPASGGSSGSIRRDAAPAQPQLVRDVQRELLLVSGYTVFDDIGFEVRGTTVRLTGQVTQATLKNAAEQAVKELPGVRRVVNDIEVLPASVVDDQIRLAAFRAIYGEPAFRIYASKSIQPIRILVKQGCLTLEGSVANATDRQAAYAKTLSVPGVVAVSNHLKVTAG